MASVTMRDVEKVYDRTKVVHGVDLDVADEEFVVLVGPSGCGKSTVLRMIAGLEAITAGEIKIGGDRVNEMAPKDRDVAMVFQNYALYPHKTVRQNMAFGLKLRRTGRDKIDTQVNRAAEILGLSDYLDRYPRQLSGGQRQRVAMGRAIVRDPRVFLFDEPLSNLDAALRTQMRTEIKELHQELRTTSVFVTHDQDEAMSMADRIVVLRDGRVEQIGAPLELYDRPTNTFVAGFIGSPAMNFIDATVRDGAIAAEDGTSLPYDGDVQAERRPDLRCAAGTLRDGRHGAAGDHRPRRAARRGDRGDRARARPPAQRVDRRARHQAAGRCHPHRAATRHGAPLRPSHGRAALTRPHTLAAALPTRALGPNR